MANELPTKEIKSLKAKEVKALTDDFQDSQVEEAKRGLFDLADRLFTPRNLMLIGATGILIQLHPFQVALRGQPGLSFLEFWSHVGLYSNIVNFVSGATQWIVDRNKVVEDFPEKAPEDFMDISFPDDVEIQQLKDEEPKDFLT